MLQSLWKCAAHPHATLLKEVTNKGREERRVLGSIFRIDSLPPREMASNRALYCHLTSPARPTGR